MLVKEERDVWTLLAVGVACWTLGDILWSVAYAGNPPFPSVADAFYLAFYPPTYLALVLLVRHRISRFNASVWLDGLAAFLTVAAVGAAVLLEVVFASNEGKLSAEAVNLAYPLADIVLLALVVAVFGIASWRPGRAWALIGAALALSALADAVYLYESAVGSYTSGTILDALWPAALLLLAFAAWSSSTRHTDRRLEGRPLGAAPAICGLVALGVLVDSYFQHRNAAGVILAAAAIVTVIARALLTFRENVEINAHMNHLASTDELTGLGNRRKLLADLDVAVRRSRRGAMAVRALRPERLQALQRHVRAPGGGRATGAARKAARGCGRGAWNLLPARRRRVLHARSGADDRDRAVPEPDHGCADGAERQLRRLDGVRLLDPARGGRKLRRGAPHRRSAPLRAEVPGADGTRTAARRAPAGARGARAEPACPRRRRRDAQPVAGGRAGNRRCRTRGARSGGAAPRRRQARDSRQRALEGRAARRERASRSSASTR